VFGIIQRNDFTSKLKGAFAGMGGGQGAVTDNPALHDPRVLLAPAQRVKIPAPVLDKITAVLSSSITHTFMWALIPTALAFITALAMSKESMSSSVELQQAMNEQ
jgi:hypothetical protein